jgi:hypothetical protein
MIGLVHISLSVNNIKDFSKVYDDITNAFHFLRICYFFYHNRKTIMQKSSTIGIKINFAGSNRIKFDRKLISKSELR